MTVTLPLVVGGVEDSWVYPRGSNDGYLCGYGGAVSNGCCDVPTLIARAYKVIE